MRFHKAAPKRSYLTRREADLLLAVIARFDAEPRNGSAKEREVDALRRNHPGKPGVGTLLSRQQGQQIFPWFHEGIVLRKMRGAHPAPVGSTDPVRAAEEDAGHAEQLFAGIIAGWERSMAETRGSRL